MKSTISSFRFLRGLLLAIALWPVPGSARVSNDGDPAYAGHTVALWLFDEAQYPYTPLLDAGPYGYDLRLYDSGRVAASGRYGNALALLTDANWHAYYSEWDGEVVTKYMRGPDGQPSGLWGPTIAPERLLATLAGPQWTCEFWLRLLAAPTVDAAVVHLGHAYNPGLALNLTGGVGSFRLTNAYAGWAVTCSNQSGILTDGQWHHVAFTVSPPGNLVKHYLDGQLQAAATVTAIPTQPVPPTVYPPSLASTNGGYGVFNNSKNYSRFRTNRFNLSLGENRQGTQDLNALLDELRFSSVVRYTNNFPPPGSFSRNYGSNAPPDSVATGPPLLFGTNAPAGPVLLGNRRHLFIDGALLDTTNQVQWRVNPPTIQGMSQDFGGDYAAVDHSNKVYLVVPDGYSSSEGIARLWMSDNGTNFTAPNLGLFNYGGTTNNNILLLRAPMWARAFKDTNPNVPPEERFKLSAWVANSGIILYTSPDLIHWRRNETMMLPLVSGGGAETYWDDQNGWYQLLIKRDSSFRTTDCPLVGGVGYRVAVGFQTRNVTQVWPFVPMNSPWYEAYSMPCVSCEGPIVFANNTFGQVYRTRAIKYEWAPDVYLAFVWRLRDADELRQTELMVSRDGQNWKGLGSLGLYLPTGQVVNGRITADAMVQQGLIRRGNELWHYGEFSTEAHGGGDTLCARLVQRLDGFVSLDAGASMGTVVTRPLVFQGNELALNLNAQGGVARVGILDEAGTPLPAFGASDCDPITSDAVDHVVTWGGVRTVSSLAGTPVRLRFELQNAKLYAMEFRQRSLAIPQIDSVTREGAAVRFSFNRASNQHYAVEFRNAAAGPSPITILTNIPAQPTVGTTTILDSFTPSNRFYRVRTW